MAEKQEVTADPIEVRKIWNKVILADYPATTYWWDVVAKWQKETEEKGDDCDGPPRRGEERVQYLFWLRCFIETCITRGPTHIANSLCQMGVEGPLPWMEESYEGGYDHDFRPDHNRNVWEVLSACGLIQTMRAVMLRDLKATGPTTSDPASDVRYGRIFHKEYARVLLDNFVKAAPNEDWVVFGLWSAKKYERNKHKARMPTTERRAARTTKERLPLAAQQS